MTMRVSRRTLGWTVLAWACLGAVGCQVLDLTALKEWNSARPARAAARRPRTLTLTEALAGVNDTARIVYAAEINGAAQIFSVQPDGARGIQLTTDPRYKCRPVWSLDHRQIAFFRFPSDRPVDGPLDIVVMQANGDGQREVVKALKVDIEATRPSWSLDGKVIYVQERDFPSVLFGYDVATGRQVETIRLPKPTFLDRANSLSPNTEWIAGSGPSRSGGLRHIGVVRRADPVDTDLMTPFSRIPLHVGGVVWAYDSRLVAFELDNLIIVMPSRMGPDFRIYPITPQEVGGELSGPAFSPGGQYLACVQGKSREGQVGTGDREVRSDLWVMRINGREPRQITATGTCFDPQW
jgi:hypothetical protein